MAAADGVVKLPAEDAQTHARVARSPADASQARATSLAAHAGREAEKGKPGNGRSKGRIVRSSFENRQRPNWRGKFSAIEMDAKLVKYRETAGMRHATAHNELEEQEVHGHWDVVYEYGKRYLKRFAGQVFTNIVTSPWTIVLFLALSVIVAAAKDGHSAVFGSLPRWTRVKIPNFMTGIVFTLLSFLNSFRSNTAYARWWEGRCLWGKHVYASIDLVQKFSAYVPFAEMQLRMVDLVILFAHFSRLLLRSQDGNVDAVVAHLDPFRGGIDEDELRTFAQCYGWKAYGLISAMRHLINDACGESGAYKEDSVLLQTLDFALSDLAQCIGGCIRIRNAPLPKTYLLYLHLCTFFYCSLLPFTVVDELGWWTPLCTLLNTTMLLGIQGISEAMEEPFGLDEDDLKLDSFCLTIEAEVRGLQDFASKEGYAAKGLRGVKRLKHENEMDLYRFRGEDGEGSSDHHHFSSGRSRLEDFQEDIDNAVARAAAEERILVTSGVRIPAPVAAPEEAAPAAEHTGVAIGAEAPEVSPGGSRAHLTDVWPEEAGLAGDSVRLDVSVSAEGERIARDDYYKF